MTRSPRPSPDWIGRPAGLMDRFALWPVPPADPPIPADGARAHGAAWMTGMRPSPARFLSPLRGGMPDVADPAPVMLGTGGFSIRALGWHGGPSMFGDRSPAIGLASVIAAGPHDPHVIAARRMAGSRPGQPRPGRDCIMARAMTRHRCGPEFEFPARNEARTLTSPGQSGLLARSFRKTARYEQFP